MSFDAADLIALQEKIKRAGLPPFCLGRRLLLILVINGKIKGFYGTPAHYKRHSPIGFSGN